MSGRLPRIAPALAVAFLVCGCSIFAGDPPPAEIVAEDAIVSLKDEWEATVIKASVGPPAPAPSRTALRRPPLSSPSTKSCRSDSECVVVLNALINDPQRNWIRQPQSPAEYANGIRFFAYRALRTRLSCQELELAVADMQVAAARLRSAGPDVSAAQAASALSLAAAVSSELQTEIGSRCRA